MKLMLVNSASAISKKQAINPLMVYKIDLHEAGDTEECFIYIKGISAHDAKTVSLKRLLPDTTYWVSGVEKVDVVPDGFELNTFYNSSNEL